MKLDQTTSKTNNPQSANQHWQIIRIGLTLIVVALISVTFFNLGATPAEASNIMGVTLTPTLTNTPTATDVPPTRTPVPPPPSSESEPNIRKSVSAIAVVPGEIFTYDIHVSNQDTKIKNVFVRDPLPAALEYVSATTSKGSVYLSSNKVVIAEVVNLQPAESVHVKITVKVAEGTPDGEKICNTGRVQYIIEGSSRGNNSNSACLTVGDVPPPTSGIVDTPEPTSTTSEQTPGDPETPPLTSEEGNVHYMVKYVCGVQDEVESGEPPVKPANYATAINIQNYLGSETPIGFRPALFYVMGDEAPATYDFKSTNIAPMSVLALDCNTLWDHMDIKSGTFIEGMVDISAMTKLPVVAVYTAEITDQMDLTTTGAGISIDVEYIEPFLTVLP